MHNYTFLSFQVITNSLLCSWQLPLSVCGPSISLASVLRLFTNVLTSVLGLIHLGGISVIGYLKDLLLYEQTSLTLESTFNNMGIGGLQMDFGLWDDISNSIISLGAPKSSPVTFYVFRSSYPRKINKNAFKIVSFTQIHSMTAIEHYHSAGQIRSFSGQDDPSAPFLDSLIWNMLLRS